MKIRHKYGSMEELERSELRNSKSFEGGNPPLDITALAKSMKKYDPDGEKAFALAKKYRSKKRINKK